MVFGNGKRKSLKFGMDISNVDPNFATFEYETEMVTCIFSFTS